MVAGKGGGRNETGFSSVEKANLAAFTKGTAAARVKKHCVGDDAEEQKAASPFFLHSYSFPLVLLTGKALAGKQKAKQKCLQSPSLRITKLNVGRWLLHPD